jgi:pimeloyl-ACP methyl ester carboxylesterase
MASSPPKRSPSGQDRPELPAERSIRLADGRQLVYLEIGDPDGTPVIHNHGGLSSALDVFPAHTSATASAVRIIAPNRPGVGRSALQPGRSTAGWSADVAELADQLGIEQFGVLGWSLGGAFAQAAAVDLPDRVTTLSLVASTIPPTWAGANHELNRMDRLFLGLHQRGAKLDRTLFRTLRLLARRAPAALARTSHLPPDDASVLAAAIAEGLRHAHGVIDEYHCMAVPWGFEPSAIACRSEVWQGDADDLVPASWGRRLADAIPGASLREVSGGTHFLAYDRWDEILEAFTAEG